MASFIGMFYFFETNPSIGFIIFGQYFFSIWNCCFWGDSLCSGLTVLGCWINAKKKLKARCTSFVDATVILINRKKTPIYEFEFNNKKFKMRGCLDKKKKVGDHCNLQVNPNNPREVYFDFIREKIATYFFSLSIAASGIVLIVIAFINFL